MIPLGLLHTGCAAVALASGAVVLLRRKGTRSHRRLGWVYVASMLALNVTALMIYRLFGGFGPFHVAALISLGTISAAIYSILVLRRRGHPKWLEHHYYWMTWSYVGLLAAALSEAATRLPGVPFWRVVVVASALALALGARMIKRRAPGILASVKPSA